VAWVVEPLVEGRLTLLLLGGHVVVPGDADDSGAGIRTTEDEVDGDEAPGSAALAGAPCRRPALGAWVARAGLPFPHVPGDAC
jgi:hypothetical protein